jgi:hypothetical protein
VALPPNMYLSLAAWFTIWSIATQMKSMNIRSTIGRSPVTAAPMPRPMMACSLIGVSTTRRSPNSLLEAAVRAEHAAEGADVLAGAEHVVVGRHRLADGLVERLDVGELALMRLSRRLRSVYTSASMSVGVGERAVLGELRSPLDVGAQLVPDRVEVGGVACRLDQPLLEGEDRVALLPLGDLVVGAVLQPEVLDAVVVVEAVGLGLDQRRASPRRARATASTAASCTATTSMPSTITPGMP